MRSRAKSYRHQLEKAKRERPEFVTVKDFPDVRTGVPEAQVPVPAPSPPAYAVEKQEHRSVDERAAKAQQGLKQLPEKKADTDERVHVDGFKIRERLNDQAYRDAGYSGDRERYCSSYSSFDW